MNALKHIFNLSQPFHNRQSMILMVELHDSRISINKGLTT